VLPQDRPVAGADAALEVRLLGPVQAVRADREIALGGPRQRAVLALLVLDAGQVVPAGRLVEEVWRGSPPAGAGKTLRSYLSRLRALVGADAPLVARGGGYVITVAPDRVDARRFERLVAAGQAALGSGDPGAAAARFGDALGLWRGPALAGVGDVERLVREAARLEELRLVAVEGRIEAEVELGRPGEMTGELERLVAEFPLREKLWRLLVLALYRAERQADALAAYRRARELLVTELGIEPGEELRALEQAVLRQEVPPAPPAARHNRPAPETSFAGRAQELAEPARPVGETQRLRLVGADRKKRLLAVAGALALVVSLLVVVAARGSAHLAAAANTVGVIDTGQPDLSAVVTGVGRPNGVASGAGAVWVTDSVDDQLLRVDSADQVDDRIPVGRGPAGVATGGGEVWVANQLDGTVSEVNPGAGEQVRPAIPVGIGPSAVAFGFGSVWVANVTSDSLTRIDAATGKVAATIGLGSSPAGVAVGAGSVWVAAQDTDELLRVDPAGDRVVQAIPAGQSPDGVAVGAGSVWVADAGGAVTRFDPRTGAVHTINVGGTPAGVAYASGAVWVANSLAGGVNKIDPATGTAQLIRLGNEPTDLAAVGGHVWATVLPSLASHRGGTLTVLNPVPQFGPADPAVAYYLWAWQMLSMTNDGLVGYRRVAGLAGDQLVPDLATTLPVPTDGGRTYVFQLRSGIRYSTGQLVRPEDFRRAIERVFMINNQAGNGITPWYAGIVGARQCERSPSRCDLARGIVTSDAANTVTFHLTAPDPQFLYKLAFSWAYAVPPGTPDRVITPAQLPATGPYMTKSFVPGHTWVLVRNPRFRPWSQQAQPGGYPDRIVERYDVAPGQAVTDVEHGRADALLSPPPGSLGQLTTRYTSQLHSGPVVELFALALNTRVPPFNSLAARRALNYAIDKNTMIALNGGRLTAQPACQILPPTMPGYQPYCPYTRHPSPGGAWTAPDLARAQQLVRASGTRGDKVTVPGATFSYNAGESPAIARYIASVLDRLGYRASVRLFTNYFAFSAFESDSRDRPQLSYFTWLEDYPAPWDFIGPLFTCGSFVPDNPGNLNAAEFCDPRIDTQVRQALSLQAGGLAAATPSWTAIDHELTDQAPWVPLYNPRDLTLLSTRVGNYQFHPYWNLLIDQLWVR
jgi:YVTN family beta-propeller protein